MKITHQHVLMDPSLLQNQSSLRKHSSLGQMGPSSLRSLGQMYESSLLRKHGCLEQTLGPIYEGKHGLLGTNEPKTWFSMVNGPQFPRETWLLKQMNSSSWGTWVKLSPKEGATPLSSQGNLLEKVA